MSGEQWLVAIAWANVAIWAVLAGKAAWMRMHRVHLPDYMVTAAIVATMSASIGGAITAMGFLHVLSVDLVQLVGAAWRTAMLSAGVYALGWATFRWARTKLRPDRQQPPA